MIQWITTFLTSTPVLGVIDSGTAVFGLGPRTAHAWRGPPYMAYNVNDCELRSCAAFPARKGDFVDDLS